MSSEGWAVELNGGRLDLEDLRAGLQPPLDPWIEDYDDNGTAKLVLRSASWKSLEHGEMVSDAERLIGHINGALAIEHDDAELVQVGPTRRFRADGSEERVLILGTAHISLRGVRSRITVSTNGGTAAPPASKMRNWLERARIDDFAADMLTFITRADNWFDLYKAMEGVERLIGGERIAKANWRDWTRLRQTANRNRHAPDPVKFPPHANPPTLDEGRSILLSAAREL